MVSVIIPNYNHARYLPARIESVLSQTFQDFEVIILDDCSKDDSREVIEKYAKHPKVSHVVFNETNSGSTFKQWQKGVSLAKGEWIWFAESDDYCEPTLLAHLVENAKQCEDVVVSYCQSYYFEDGEEHLKRDMTFFTDSVDTEHWKHNYCNSGAREIADFLMHRCTIPNASAVIFRKDAYQQVDQSFTTMKMCGDWMLWVQMLKIGKIAFYATPLNYFRAHGATTRAMTNLAKKRLRAEEEYLVALNLKDSGYIETKRADKRIAEVVQQYTLCFSTSDMVKLLLMPNSFPSKIPYKQILAVKIKSYFKVIGF